MSKIDIDKKQSASDFNNLVKPAIEKHCDATIIHLENLGGKLPLMLDRFFSTDALFIKGGKMFGLSSRIQHGKNWNDFSIRAGRDSKKKTEFEKISTAINEKKYLPEITTQAYITDDELTVGICQTTDLFAYLQKYKPKTVHTTQSEVGQAEFYPVSWQDFKSKGYRLKIIQEKIKKSTARTDD